MRHGSDSARAWARQLRFGDVRAKSVLMAICNYVDEEGAASPGIPTLAEDTDQSNDSIRRRLKDLEEFGVIARFARFVDNNGRINAEARGRRTSDEIRCIFGADQATVDAAIASRSANDQGPGADPSQQPGSAETGHGPDPSHGPLAAGEGQTLAGSEGDPGSAARGINTSNYKEDNPPTPLKGGIAPDSPEQEDKRRGGAEPRPGSEEAWRQFEAAFTGDGTPIMRHSLGRQLFGALSIEEWHLATKAASGYVAWRKREKNPPTKVSVQTFLRERGAWERFAALAPALPPSPAAFVAEGEPLFNAVSVVRRICTGAPRAAEFIYGKAERGFHTFVKPTPDLLALAPFHDGRDWLEFDAAVAGDCRHIAAWRERIAAWTTWSIEPLAIPVLGPDGAPAMRTVKGIGKVYEFQVTRKVVRVPLAWPPNKDGSITWAPSDDDREGENEPEDVEADA